MQLKYGRGGQPKTGSRMTMDPIWWKIKNRRWGGINIHIHPLGSIDIHTKFHGYLANSCQDNIYVSNGRTDRQMVGWMDRRNWNGIISVAERVPLINSLPF